MQPITKIVVAILVVALIAVLGLIAISNNAGDKTPMEEATAAPIAQAATTNPPQATDEPAPIEDTEESGEASNEAQEHTAQDVIYEGALAGMTEEEIEKQALSEEQSHGSETEGND